MTKQNRVLPQAIVKNRRTNRKIVKKFRFMFGKEGEGIFFVTEDYTPTSLRKAKMLFVRDR